MEALAGLTVEQLSTDIENPYAGKRDSLVNITACGLSLGVTAWFNVFKRQTFGVQVFYTYATYNQSMFLKTPIGGNSTSVSLVWRFPGRGEKVKKQKK
jgi:hypothetical protein